MFFFFMKRSGLSPAPRTGNSARSYGFVKRHATRSRFSISPFEFRFSQPAQDSPLRRRRFAHLRSDGSDAILRSRRKSALPRMTMAILRILGVTAPMRFPGLACNELFTRSRGSVCAFPKPQPGCNSPISQEVSPAPDDERYSPHLRRDAADANLQPPRHQAPPPLATPILATTKRRPRCRLPDLPGIEPRPRGGR